MRTMLNHLMDNLAVIWTIAAKDILDAWKNRVVLGIVCMGVLITLMPRGLSLMLEQPLPVVLVVGPGATPLAKKLENDENLVIVPLDSLQEMPGALCNASFPEMGLEIPADFISGGSDSLILQAYMCWGDRLNAQTLQDRLAPLLAPAFGRSSEAIAFRTEMVYPTGTVGLGIGIATINAVLLVLMIGTFLLPHLFFEEKQNKTLQALLISPASIGQVVLGKALAGFFYVVVISLLIFALQWTEVIAWSLVPVFILGGGIFFVGLGLVIGSLFDSMQEATGWMTILLLLLAAGLIVNMLQLELTPMLGNIVAWMPSVALGDLFSLSLLAGATPTRVLRDAALLLGFSLPLYAWVIWHVRRSDR